jgi:hypothetical protein
VLNTYAPRWDLLTNLFAGIDHAARRVLRGAQIGAPGLAAGADACRQLLAAGVRPRDTAKVGAFAASRAGDEKGHVGRLRRGLLGLGGGADADKRGDGQH